MAHIWDQLVLGGVDQPQIILLYNNFCSNPFFTKNLDGWVLVVDTPDSETFDRVEHSLAYGQYMGNIVYTSNRGWVELENDDYASETIQDKTFFFCVDVISDEDFTIEFIGDSAFGTTNFDETGGEVKKCFVIATATGQFSESIKVRLYATTKTGGTMDADMHFDNVYFTEVYKDYTMPQPHDAGKILFEKIKVGENVLITHRRKEFRVRWKPNYLSEYAYLSKDNEEKREIIAKSELVFCIPHIDVDWGFLGKWKHTEFIRDYPFNEYSGHIGVIAIEGNEYFLKKPDLKTIAV